MTPAGLRPPFISLHAHISERTPRDLRGVESLTHLGAQTFACEPGVIAGRVGPYGRTAWQAE
jgi:hypothetical protein